MRNESKKYAIEVASLKEKRQYNIMDVGMHLHEKNNKCIILYMEKDKNQFEVFELEQALELHNTFKEFKRLAEEYEEKLIMQGMAEAKAAAIASKK